MVIGKATSAFEQHVASILKQVGVRFETQPLLGGLRPDFLVHHEDGTTTVIEVKGWAPTEDTASRAAEQAMQYQALSGAFRALVVVPELRNDQRRPGVVALADLAAVLSSRPATAIEEKHSTTKPRGF